MNLDKKGSFLTIDRSLPFGTDTKTHSLYESFLYYFAVAKENPLSSALSVLDPARIEIKMIFDEPANLINLKPTEYNQHIQKNLTELETAGYTHLDAPALETLMFAPEYIPTAWRAVTESENLPNNLSGSIGFYGTYFSRKEDSTDTYTILTPFCNRGSWTIGHTDLFFSPIDISMFENETVWGVRKYAAVYR